MPRNDELISRLGSIRRTIVNIKEITGLIGLQTQVCLIEGDHQEVRSQWIALTLELSHLSTVAENVLNKVTRSRVVTSPVGAGGGILPTAARLKSQIKLKRGSTRRTVSIVS